ncbi:MAG: HAD-IIB family hydrolase [Gammaproteobacteria bacterium]|nr:HAD-IIB family hydrolase [Gammaproteobacteria bacterium]
MVIFSDLDGTLLDHDTYDWQPAASALEVLQQRDIPVVLVSSKTLAEIVVYRRDMALPHPVVVENGAGIHVPDGYFATTLQTSFKSIDRSDLQKAYTEMRGDQQIDCIAFYELGDAGIAEVTGLSIQQARQANTRQASEPILWRDSEQRLSIFAANAAARGLRCVRGGRFVHLMGPIDKAIATARLLDAYRQKWPGATIRSVALGDGPNDLDMLRAADVAVVIKGRHGQPMPLGDHPRVLRPELPGPAGWNEAIRMVLGRSQYNTSS